MLELLVRPRLLSEVYGPLSLHYSVTTSNGMTSNSTTNIRIRMHPIHLQHIQLPLIDCLKFFQHTKLRTHPDIDILSSASVIKFESMYPPILSSDPSPKIRNKPLVLLKYLKIFLQQSNAPNLDSIDVCS